jgi:hypothetical protein
MTTSENIDAIAAALAKAQASMKNATLNKVNPHFKSKYADLAGIRDAVTPPLAANGIAVTQTLDADSDRYFVRTRLMHVSGQWIESLCPIIGMGDMQKMGSAVTYARRYSLSAICGIAADEDDDGNAAVVNGNGHAKQATPKAPDGYEDWLTDMSAVADNGSEALKAAWDKSKPEYRKHLTATDGRAWDAIKRKAALANAKEPAHA